MKILLIMTGGTICSYPNGEGQLSPDAAAAAPLLVERLREEQKFARIRFDVRQVLNVLSENMTFSRLDRLLAFFRGLSDEELASADGIIIAHGTDTLAYTSSLLALALAGLCKPVFLVSSNYTLSRPEANGHANFRAAAELIMSGFGPGVYVPYRNSDGVIYLHSGAKLRQCGNYSCDFFSDGMKPVGQAEPYKAASEHPPVYALRRLEDCVMKIEPYVGIDYSAYRPGGQIKAILHGSYHSATACVERAGRNEPFTRYSALWMLGYCRRHKIDFWLAGLSRPEGGLSDILDGAYSTTADLIKSGAKPILSLTPETAYMKLTLAYSLGYEGEEIDAFMERELADERLGGAI